MKLKSYFILLLFSNTTIYTIQRPQFDFNKWFLIFTPFYGEGSNEINLPFRTVQFPQNKSYPEIHLGQKQISGSGKGYGYQISAFKKNWQFLNVSFVFPVYPNKDSIDLFNFYQNPATKVTGTIFLMRYTWLYSSFIEPFAGFYYFQGIGPHDESVVKNFLIYSYNTQKWVQIPEVKARVYVFEPSPQIGLQFKIPIQNWKIETIYSYAFEHVNTNIKTSAGSIHNYNIENLYNFYNDLFINTFNINENNIIYPTDTTIKKKYYGHRIGLALYLDYRRFISIRISMRRDLTFNRNIYNIFFNLIFSKYLGLSFFYEDSQRSVGKIRYWLAGPSFIFQF